MARVLGLGDDGGLGKGVGRKDGFGGALGFGLGEMDELMPYPFEIFFNWSWASHLAQQGKCQNIKGQAHVLFNIFLYIYIEKNN